LRDATLPSGTAEPIRISHQLASNFSSRYKTRIKHETAEQIYCCSCTEKSKGGDGDAAATVAYAMKGGDGEEEEDVDKATALPHAVGPVGAPNVYCCGGADESEGGGDGEEERNGEAAAALQHAVAPVKAFSMYLCGGAEERKGFDGDAAATFLHAVGPVGAPSVAAAGFYGEWIDYRKSCCSAELLRFRKDQVTRRDSAARLAIFDNWRLTAEQGSKMAWSV
jgi:hypothetical protein